MSHTDHRTDNTMTGFSKGHAHRLNQVNSKNLRWYPLCLVCRECCPEEFLRMDSVSSPVRAICPATPGHFRSCGGRPNVPCDPGVVGGHPPQSGRFDIHPRTGGWRGGSVPWLDGVVSQRNVRQRFEWRDGVHLDFSRHHICGYMGKQGSLHFFEESRGLQHHIGHCYAGRQ